MNLLNKNDLVHMIWLRRTVLIWRECACVYVDVRVDLDGGHM